MLFDKPIRCRRGGRARPARLILLGYLALLVLAGCAAGGGPDPSERASERALEARFAQAVELLRRERFEDAADLLGPLSEDYPQLPGIHVNLGIAHAALDRPEAAAEAWQTALAVAPEHAEALALLALQHRRQGRFPDARALYQRLLDAHPDHPAGNLNLGILCDLYLRDLACALERYQHYRTLEDDEDMLRTVGFWIADIERRLPEESTR